MLHGQPMEGLGREDSVDERKWKCADVSFLYHWCESLVGGTTFGASSSLNWTHEGLTKVKIAPDAPLK